MRLPRELERRGILAQMTLKSLGLGLLLFHTVAHGQAVPTFQVNEFGIDPRPAAHSWLLEMESVQQELAMSEAEKKEQNAIMLRFAQQLREARHETRDRTKFREARVAVGKAQEAAAMANLTTGQRERIEQIHLQAEGPFAFAWPEDLAAAFVGHTLPERLKLSEVQDQRLRKIVIQGSQEMRKAASFPIVLNTKNGPANMEAIAAFVASPEFQTAKRNAAKAGREASAAVIRRIEEVLTDGQRTAYHELLGKPFELSKLTLLLPGQDEQEFDRRVAADALGLGGQRADPSFNTKVDKPAYAGSSRTRASCSTRPTITSTPRAGDTSRSPSLITSDGYKVIPQPREVLTRGAQKGRHPGHRQRPGRRGMGEPGAGDPAFSDAECDAVRDWVQEGGSLLLITDHAPMGAAAECLAKRFGVSMSKGATADPANSEGDDTSLVFSRQNQLLGDHPITRGRDDSERVNHVQTFTGTSVKGPDGSVPILKLADTAVDLAMTIDKPASAAGRAQGVALPLGQGRVVVMGEAAELSAQLIGDETSSA